MLISALTIVPSRIMSEVTLPLPMVVANEPVPEPVTSPVKVMVWSPVFDPEIFEALIAPAMVRFPADVILLEDEKN